MPAKLTFVVFRWDEDDSAWRVHCEINAISHQAATDYLRLGQVREGTFMVLSKSALNPIRIKVEPTIEDLEFGEWV